MGWVAGRGPFPRAGNPLRYRGRVLLFNFNFEGSFGARLGRGWDARARARGWPGFRRLLRPCPSYQVVLVASLPSLALPLDVVQSAGPPSAMPFDMCSRGGWEWESVGHGTWDGRDRGRSTLRGKRTTDRGQRNTNRGEWNTDRGQRITTCVPLPPDRVPLPGARGQRSAVRVPLSPVHVPLAPVCVPLRPPGKQRNIRGGFWNTAGAGA